MSHSQTSDSDSGKPRKRRPRYSGTHPKQFAEKYKEHAIDAHPDLRAHLQAKGKTPAGTHVPILVAEIMDLLKPAAGQIVADCTLGYGGHAAEFAKRIGPSGRLIALDVDAVELERTRQRLTSLYPDVPMTFVRSNFAGIDKVMQSEAPEGFDILFADLGLSSMQIDDPERGMSFRKDGPLDMRMDQRRPRTAADLLAELSEEQLADALWQLSDEPDHLAIARHIVNRRQAQPLLRIRQLVELVLEVKGLTLTEYRQRQRQKPGLHPAARTFQTLRMLVNDELGTLSQLLRVAPYCLRPAGRIGIISFHSGEDRLVKHAFADGLRAGLYSAVSETVITPTRQEIVANSRSASAKFRWALRAR